MDAHSEKFAAGEALYAKAVALKNSARFHELAEKEASGEITAEELDELERLTEQRRECLSQQ